MNRLPGVLLLISISVNGIAQDQTVRKLQAEAGRSFKKENADTVQKTWTRGMNYGIHLGQGSQSNWAAGGDDFTFSVSSALNLFAFYKKNRNSWDNSLDLNFGYTKTSSLGGRKNDDRIDLLSKYGYALNSRLNLTTLVNFRSQLLNGYTYQEPGEKQPSRTFSSAFLSPAYIIASQGLDYKPGDAWSLFISPVTSRWVVMNNDTLASKGEYGLAAGKHSINQLGAFATINYQMSFNKTVSYRARLDVFSNYKQKPQNADLYMTNVFSARVSKLIAFSWNVDMIYDDDAKLFGKYDMSPALQLKSVIGIGLQVKI